MMPAVVMSGIAVMPGVVMVLVVVCATFGLARFAV